MALYGAIVTSICTHYTAEYEPKTLLLATESTSIMNLMLDDRRQSKRLDIWTEGLPGQAEYCKGCNCTPQSPVVVELNIGTSRGHHMTQPACSIELLLLTVG